MATYTARVRSRELKADPIMRAREFGGTEQVMNEQYVFDDLIIAADNDEQAIRLAHQLAKKRNMIVIFVVKEIYRRQEGQKLRKTFEK